MMKFKILILITVLMLSIDVDAFCGSDELNNLRDLASKVEFSYEYELIEEEDYLTEAYLVAKYAVTAYNLDNSFTVTARYKNVDSDIFSEVFKYNSSKTTTLKDLSSGNLRISIVASSGECKDRNLATKELNLPYYNYFYESETCLQYPDFKYCQDEFLDSYVTNTTFDRELNKYTTSLEKVEEEPEEEKKTNKLLIGLYIGGGVLILGVIGYGCYYVIQRERKKRSL